MAELKVTLDMDITELEFVELAEMQRKDFDKNEYKIIFQTESEKTLLEACMTVIRAESKSRPAFGGKSVRIELQANKFKRTGIFEIKSRNTK